MNKIIPIGFAVIGLSGCVSIANALTYEAKDHIMLTDQQKHDLFTTRGLPFPGEPPKILPAKELGEMGKQAMKFLSEKNKSISKKGYFEQDNYEAMKHLADVDRMKADAQKNITNTNPQHTHLRIDAKSLQVGYEYKEIPTSLVSEVIGFSPWGSYAQGLGWTGIGWSGVTEFFVPKEMKEFTLCSYSQLSIEMTGTTATFIEGTTSKEINGKLSSSDVLGNQRTAFSYSVEWWDNKFRHELECYQKTYSPETMPLVIEMAKTIDKFISE